MAGLTVTLIEPRDGTIDKACGEGLMPGAVPAARAPRSAARTGCRCAASPTRDGTRSVTHRFRTGPGSGCAARHFTQRSRRAPRRSASPAQPARSNTSSRMPLASRSPEPRWSRCGILAARGGRAALHHPQARGPRARGARPSPLRTAPPLRRRAVERVHRGALGTACRGLRDPGRAGCRRARRARTAAHRLRRDARRDPGTRGPASPVRRPRASCVAPARSGSARAHRCRGGCCSSATRPGTSTRSRARGCGSDSIRRAPRSRASRPSGPTDYARAWREVTRDFRVLTSGLVGAASSPLRGAIVPTARALPWLYGSIVERLAR